ncbi:MAG: hypothetical protein GX303_06915 [Clostridiales bacterium]|nr:hypothetical protein [Clostridiales bacterium]
MKSKKRQPKSERTAIEQQEAAIRANAKMRLRFTNAKIQNDEDKTNEQNQYR